MPDLVIFTDYVSGDTVRPTWSHPGRDGVDTSAFWKMVTPEELKTTTDSQHIMPTEVLSETP